MYNSLGNISAPVFKLVPFYPNLVSITREKRKITGALRGGVTFSPPLAPRGGTPLRGALLFPRGKSNQKDAQGEARRTDASRPQAGPPPENPLVLRGCSIRGIFWGFPARGVGMYSPLFLLPPICRHCNRVGSTGCASCGGPYTPRWRLALLPVVAGKLKHFSSNLNRAGGRVYPPQNDVRHHSGVLRRNQNHQYPAHAGPSGPESEGKSIRKAAQAGNPPPHKKRRALALNGGFLRGRPA